MPLKLLIRLQASFALASVLYLVASGLRAQIGDGPLSVAPVLFSILLFTLYSASLLLPSSGRIGWYRVAMAPAILAFGGGGVVGNVVHYAQTGLEDYAGMGAFVVAVSINFYGTILNIIAAAGWFRVSTNNQTREISP